LLAVSAHILTVLLLYLLVLEKIKWRWWWWWRKNFRPIVRVQQMKKKQ